MEQYEFVKAWVDVADTEKEIRAKQEEVRDIDAKRAELETTLKGLQTDVARLKKETAQMVESEQAKRSKIAAYEEKIKRWKVDLTETVRLRAQNEKKVLTAEAAVKEMAARLPAFTGTKEAADTAIPELEDDLAAAAAARDEAEVKAGENLDALLTSMFVTDNRSLIYPNQPHVSLPDPIVRLKHSWRENYGYVQMLNNPMYMTDRLLELIQNLRSEADDARLSTAPQGVELNNAQLCRIVMNSAATRGTLSDAVYKARLAHLLFERLEPVKMRLIEEAGSEKTNKHDLHALGRAAEEMAETYQQGRGNYSSSQEASARRTKNEIMALYNTGKIFDNWVKRYNVGVLAVLPIYELIRLSGTTAIKTVQKGYLKWIQVLILGSDPEAEAAFCERELLPKFLAQVIEFLDEFVNFDSIQWRLKDGYQHGQFRTKFRALRERLGLPGFGAVFSPTPASSTSNLAEWEMAASISGWDSDIKAAFITDSAGKIIIITDPSRLFSEIWGLGPLAAEDGVSNLVYLPMTKTTLEVVVHLLLSPDTIKKMSTQGVRLEFVGMDRRVKIQDTKGADEGIRQLICVVKLEAVWVVLALTKGPSQPQSDGSPGMQIERFTHVWAFHPLGHVGGLQVKQALALLGLGTGGNNLTEDDVTHVGAPIPASSNAQHLWDTQTICHILALLNCQHHWTRALDYQQSVDLRHLMLRTTSRALIQSHIDNSV